ncbi:MAG: MFS transporter [Akkermansiaceae bacterium]|jgi:dipeptide/tripeptide permease|nr:MFS transporter [Akkermansiaceae bacterium]
MTVDAIIYTGIVVLALAFVYIIWSYAKGLTHAPRELFLLFFTKVTEYSAYGGINLAFTLYLSKDMGLSDLAAGTYVGVWSVVLSLFVIVVGPVCDVIGIKRTLLVGCYLLLFSRLLMPFAPEIYSSSLVGFLPMAIGIAITGPVLSVGIKRFTTKETAALGFGLFYTLMNVGWAIGAWLFDKVREVVGEHSYLAMPATGIEISTYQVIILIGFFITVPDLVAILFMRNNVEVKADGSVVVTPDEETKERGGFLAAIWGTVRQSAVETWRKIKEVFVEKPFWIFIFMLTVTVFVRLVFQHFHYTFPKYGIRIFGEGAKIGSIYGVLNPTMIVFLVPLISALTRKISSYKLMLVGTAISAASVFIAIIPHGAFAFLNGTWVSELIFDRWLHVPAEGRTPLYFTLITFIVIFTIGEAIWSPRLMQFTAEIAPKGKEGSYLSLAILPFFVAKLFAGPMSGWLVQTYTPEGLPPGPENYPGHTMVWVWIGGMALVTPIGLFLFRKLFRAAEKDNGA